MCIKYSFFSYLKRDCSVLVSQQQWFDDDNHFYSIYDPFYITLNIRNKIIFAQIYKYINAFTKSNLKSMYYSYNKLKNPIIIAHIEQKEMNSLIIIWPEFMMAISIFSYLKRYLYLTEYKQFIIVKLF